METMHGYSFNKSDGHYSPNGVWYKATSNGSTFFLKKFQQPKFPKEGISPVLYALKKKECDEWLASKKKLIKALNELGNGTGNIVSPRDIFREKLCFYQTTYWIDFQTDSLEQIKSYSYDDKVMILKTYASALKKVHSKGIVHGDLKPDNILIGKSGSGKPVAKLIDFDDSYFSQKALPPELTVVTDAYQSPELAAYKRGHEEYREKMTCSSDVFASAIIFHQFWCGNMPMYSGYGNGRFLYEAISAGETYTLDSSIPDWLQNLLKAMLQPLPEKRPTMEEVHIAVTEQKYSSKTEEIEKKLDLSKIDIVLNAIPKDLSKYTEQSVTNLKKVIHIVENNSEMADQDEVDRLTKALFKAYKMLEERAHEEFSIEPVFPLPAGYSRVHILSEKKVCAYTLDGSKMIIPRVVAISMGIVHLK